MLTASLVLEPSFVVAPLNRRIFGSFVEHMGRCVYTGIYEPGHPSADDEGFRTDVLELVRELGVTTVRYPGGNFVSGFNWEDRVGPVDLRPTRLDLAWRSMETQRVRPRRIHPLVPQGRRRTDAGRQSRHARRRRRRIELWEYCQPPGWHGAGPTCARARRRGPLRHPNVVPRQRDGRPLAARAQDGRRVRPARRRDRPGDAPVRPDARTGGLRQLRPTDADVRFLGSGGARPRLRRGRLHLDHAYYENERIWAASLLRPLVWTTSSTTSSPRPTTCAPGRKQDKRINISVDEWNVWYVSEVSHEVGQEWQVAPRISEQAYTVADAVVVGSMLITLLRHSDRVTSACLAQLVNTIAPIRSEPNGPSWRQTTFFPFALTHSTREAMCSGWNPQCPAYTTALHGEVPVVDAVATRDPDDGAVSNLRRQPASPGGPAPTTGGGRARRCQRRRSAGHGRRRPTRGKFPTAHGPRRAEGDRNVTGRSWAVHRPPRSVLELHPARHWRRRCTGHRGLNTRPASNRDGTSTRLESSCSGWIGIVDRGRFDVSRRRVERDFAEPEVTTGDRGADSLRWPGVIGHPEICSPPSPARLHRVPAAASLPVRTGSGSFTNGPLGGSLAGGVSHRVVGRPVVIGGVEQVVHPPS